MAHFNSYSNTLVITTDYDLRIFNCYTGKLEKVYADQRIVQSDTDKLVCFSEGALQRKFYVSDIKGKIECFNFTNGEMLKKVNDLVEDHQFIKKFAELLNVRWTDTQSHIPMEDTITAMYYVHANNWLITGTNSSIIKIYDESNADTSTLHGVGFN